MVNSGEYCYPTAPNTDTETVYKELFNLGSVYTFQMVFGALGISVFFTGSIVWWKTITRYACIYMNIGYKPKIGMMLEKGFYLSIYGGYERILKSHTTDTSGLDQPYPWLNLGNVHQHGIHKVVCGFVGHPSLEMSHATKY